MKESGSLDKDKASVFKYGLIAQNMWVNGNIIKPTAKGLYIMQMEMFMRDSGLMIKLVEMGLILMRMVQSMSVLGRMINKMD